MSPRARLPLLAAVLAAVFSLHASAQQQGADSTPNAAAQRPAAAPAELGRWNWERLKNDLSFTYYMAFLGPSPGLKPEEAYNNFLATPGNNGRGPLQTFYAGNLAYRINQDWGAGLTIGGIRHHTPSVDCGNFCTNSNEPELYNLRAYVSLPMLRVGPRATLYSNFAWEFPTSDFAERDKFRWGWVLNQTLAVRLPHPRFSGGVIGQIVRYHFQHDWGEDLPRIPGFPELVGPPRQILIATVAPYLNYQLAPSWQLASMLTFDWDQNGDQKNTLHFNNNLPHRLRVAVNRFFSVYPLSHVGVFLMGRAELAMNTTSVGADFTLRF